jgi:hypothetical protein
LLCQGRPYVESRPNWQDCTVSNSKPGDAQLALHAAFLCFGAWCVVGYFTDLVTAADCLSALAVGMAGLAIGAAAFLIGRARLDGVNADLVGFGLEVCELTICAGLLVTMV